MATVTQETVLPSLTMTLTTNPETMRQDLENTNDRQINVNDNCKTI
jgi:hypothetical protein